jgi:hypothetical protein
MAVWMVEFASPGKAVLGVMVYGRDALGAISEALEQWPLGDVRDVVKVERREMVR